MSLEIFYTPRSKETLTLTYNFILNKFGKAAAEKFLVKAEKTIILIADHPLMYKAASFDRSIKIGLITKQSSLFYRVNDTSIHLLFFWDNRQEPFYF
jgi:plasmid stabilization system protein ParE